MPDHDADDHREMSGDDGVKEPVYECEICGETLERYQQGKYRWCTRCRQVWHEGFNCGLQFHDEFMGAEGILEAAFIMEKIAPYMIR